MFGDLWLGECPEPGCGLPAEFVRRDRWESTDGPLETIRTRCLVGHLRDSHPQPVPLSHDMPCPYCRHPGHRFTPCDLPCVCPPHDLADDIEP